MFKKMKEKKGFTLAELLVVVAIIGVLVAVSIPIFTGQLEKSRDAVTIANLRSAYAEAQTAYMTETNSGNATYTKTTDEGGATVEVAKVVTKGLKINDFSDSAGDLPFSKVLEASSKKDNLDSKPDTYTIVFTYSDAGEIIGLETK